MHMVIGCIQAAAVRVLKASSSQRVLYSLSSGICEASGFQLQASGPSI